MGIMVSSKELINSIIEGDSKLKPDFINRVSIKVINEIINQAHETDIVKVDEEVPIYVSLVIRSDKDNRVIDFKNKCYYKTLVNGIPMKGYFLLMNTLKDVLEKVSSKDRVDITQTMMLPVGINFDSNHSFIEICFNLIVSDKYMDMRHFNEKEVSIKNFKEYNYTNTSEGSMIYLHNLIDMEVLNND